AGYRGIERDNPAGPYTGRVGYRYPPPLFPSIYPYTIQSLAELDVFPQANQVKGLTVSQVDDEFGRGNVVVGSPITIAIIIEQVARAETFRMALTDIRRRQPRSGSQVYCECLRYFFPETLQRSHVSRVEQAFGIRCKPQVKCRPTSYAFKVQFEK